MYLHEKLDLYADTDAYPFHMPGHKRRLHGWDPRSLISVDITEIDGFDNLHEPKEIIGEMQKQAAQFYHTRETLFSVNGSTAALLSAVSAAVPRGGAILMGRNCHKAVYHAVYLRDLTAYYLYPQVSPEDICQPITVEQVEQQLEEHPEVSAVLITSPTYEGLVSDIEGIANCVHDHGLPLIVDEAHGAHFGMDPYFPESAVRQGADVVIQSLHKTLPAMTQTALLHQCSQRVETDLLKRFMAIYQSSSPSYVLMGSITSCLQLLRTQKDSLFSNYTTMLEQCRKRLKRLKNFELLEGPRQDPSKLVLIPKEIMTGQALYQKLRTDYHLQLEMAADHYVIAMTSIGDSKAGFDRLCKAMEDLDHEDQ